MCGWKDSHTKNERMKMKINEYIKAQIKKAPLLSAITILGGVPAFGLMIVGLLLGWSGQAYGIESELITVTTKLMVVVGGLSFLFLWSVMFALWIGAEAGAGVIETCLFLSSSLKKSSLGLIKKFGLIFRIIKIGPVRIFEDFFGSSLQRFDYKKDWKAERKARRKVRRNK